MDLANYTIICYNKSMMKTEAQKRAQKKWGQTPGGRESARRYQNKYRQRVKRVVLTHYGNGKCACVRCGEDGIACLTIDHIKAIKGGKRINSGHFYSWLRKNLYPQDYQTLCMNCQFKKRVTEDEYRAY